MLCEQARGHLSAYLDKELTADLSAAVRAHLDTCPDCRRLFEDLRATVDLLARLPVRAAPEGVAGDVMREMERRSLLESPETAAGQPHERTLAIQRARPWPRALAVAATLLLAAGIGLFAYLGGRPGSPAPSVGSPAPSVELGRRSLDKPPAAAAIKSGGDLAAPAGATQLARERGGLGGEKYEWADEARRGAVARAGTGDLAGDEFAAGEEQNGATRLGTALAGAPTAGLANVEDVAGRQAIFGNETVVRSAPATQRPAPARGTVHDKDLTLAWFGPAKGVRLTPDGYGYTSNGSVVHYFGTVATAESGLKKLAPPDSGAVVTGAVARTDEKLTEHGAAAAGLSGPAMVQQVMNYVAEGQAPVEKLKAVATRGNLDLAENQLVVRAASRDEANKELVGLFGANGWEALPQEEASAYLRDGRMLTEADGDVVDALDVAGTAVLARKSAPRRAAAGWYFRAGRNGEDTWVILTDRDNLSRFGGQLAQARVMTVGTDSSEQFRAIERLQQQLRAHAVAKADTSGLEEARARSRQWGKAARETGTMDSNGLGETKAKAIRAEPDLKRSPETQVVRGVPAEKAAEAETARILGDRDADGMARHRDEAFLSSTAASRGAKRPPVGGTPAAKPPITPTDDDQKARRPKPAETPEAAIPETPVIALQERLQTGRKKVAAGPAAGFAVATPAKPSVTTPGEPPAPTAKPSISALAKPAAPPPAAVPAPVMKAKPAARWSLEEKEAPADTAVALRGADERRAGQRKDAVLKEQTKAEATEKRRSFAGHKEAEKLDKAGAGQRKPAKQTVAFSIPADGLTLHRVLVLPKNQVLLVVRVRQAAQAAGAAGKPASKEAEEGQRSVGEK